MQHVTLRQIAAGLALVYALVVVAINLTTFATGVAAVLYVVAAVAAPVAVLLGENRLHRGDGNREAAAQVGLGTIFGIWALPATSGLIALVAIVAGVRSVVTSRHRGLAISALLAGIALGVILLVLSFRTV